MNKIILGLCTFFVASSLISCIDEDMVSTSAEYSNYLVYEDVPYSEPIALSDGFSLLTNYKGELKITKIDTLGNRQHLATLNSYFPTGATLDSLANFSLYKATNSYLFFFTDKRIESGDTGVYVNVVAFDTLGKHISTNSKRIPKYNNSNFEINSVYFTKENQVCVVSMMETISDMRKKVYLQFCYFDTKAEIVDTVIFQNDEIGKIALIERFEKGDFIILSVQVGGGLPGQQKTISLYIINRAGVVANKVELLTEANNILGVYEYKNILYLETIQQGSSGIIETVVFKINSNGEKIWEKNLGQFYNVVAVCKTELGFLLSASKNVGGIFESNTVPEGSKVNLLTIDENFNILNERLFYGEYPSLATAILKTNSAVYILGIKKSFNYYTNTFFMKVVNN
jgi:hypothetical protein